MNCLTARGLFGASLALSCRKSPGFFSGIDLWVVPRPNISHSEEEQVVATPVLRLLGRTHCAEELHLA